MFPAHSILPGAFWFELQLIFNTRITHSFCCYVCPNCLWTCNILKSAIVVNMRQSAEQEKNQVIAHYSWI